MDGKIIKEQKTLVNYGYFQDGFVVTDKYIYVSYYYNEMNSYRIAKFTKDLELVSDDIDYKKGIDKEVELYKILKKNDRLYLVLYDESSYYIEVMDEDWNILKLNKTIEKDALSMSHFLEAFDYVDGKNIQLYKSREIIEGNNEIIISYSNW